MRPPCEVVSRRPNEDRREESSQSHPGDVFADHVLQNPRLLNGHRAFDAESARSIIAPNIHFAVVGQDRRVRLATKDLVRVGAAEQGLQVDLHRQVAPGGHVRALVLRVIPSRKDSVVPGQVQGMPGAGSDVYNLAHFPDLQKPQRGLDLPAQAKFPIRVVPDREYFSNLRQGRDEHLADGQLLARVA